MTDESRRHRGAEVEFAGIAPAEQWIRSFQGPGVVDDVTGALLPVPETSVVSGMPLTAAQTLVAGPIAQRFEHSAGANEAFSNAHGNPLDPRVVITAALQKVDLLAPPGSKPTGDPRSIISSTLRSVGLLKE